MIMGVDSARNGAGRRPYSPPAERDPFRCKLYRLSREDDAWEDLGTGFVKILVVSTDPGFMQVVKESDSIREDGMQELIHSCPLQDPNVYHLQGDVPGKESIIVWEDADQRDYALSLESSDDAQVIWSVLCGKNRTDVGALGPNPAKRRIRINLPMPSLKTLADLVNIFNRPLHPLYREALAGECVEEEWLRSLRRVFEDAEEVRNTEALTQLFHIVKGMFLLARHPLTERLLRKDCWKDFIGMMEYDDGIPPEKRFSHRKILSVDIKYRAVVTFSDDEVLERIHLNYRLMYLRDHIIARLLDDSVFMMLLQQIYMNTSQIIHYIDRSPAILDQLFHQIQDNDLQSLDFAQDCCRQMRSPGFAQVEREVIYGTMVKKDLFGILIPYINKPRRLPLPGRDVPHACSRTIALDILHMHAFHNPFHLHRYTIQNPPFLATLVSMLVEDEEPANSMASEILRWMMDFTCSHNPMSVIAKGNVLTKAEQNDFLDVLYDRNGPLPSLVSFFKDNKATGEGFDFAKQMVCEVMSVAIQRNDYQSKNFVLTHNLPVVVMKLFSSPRKFLHHAAVRVIRAIIKKDDDQCTRYLIKNTEAILKPMLEIVEECGANGNLVVSAILDTLNDIKLNKNKDLLQHLCESYPLFHQPPPILTSFVNAYNRSLEMQEYPPEQYSCGAPTSGRDETARQDAEEDARRETEYFDGDSDEEAAGILHAYEDASPSHFPPAEEMSDRKRLKRDVDGIEY